MSQRDVATLDAPAPAVPHAVGPPAGPGAQQGRRRRVSAPGLVSAGLIVAGGLYLVWLARPLWFLLDDWEFLLHRGVTLTGEHSLLQPHNEHWGTLPILVFRGLFHVVGVGHYLPYVMVTIGLHVLVCALFVIAARRAGADPWVGVVLAAVLAFFGPGGINIFWDFQMGFLGPMALALGGLLVVDRRPDERLHPLPVWTLLVAALMCSGAGLTAVAWVAAYTWLRRGLRTAVVVGSLPTLVYLGWYLAYGRGNSPAPPAPPGLVLPYMLRGLTNLWDTVVPLPGLGVVVLVVITLATVAARQHARLRAFAAAGLLALVFNYLLLALSRAGWGLDQATSTRYLYVGVLLTLPAVALSLQLAWERLADFPRPRALLSVTLVVLFVGSGAQLLRGDAELHEQWVEGSRGRVVAAATLVAEDAPLLSDLVDPTGAIDIDSGSLARPEVRERLPRVVPTPQESLDTAGYLQVGVGRDSFGLPPARGLRLDRAVRVDSDGACRRSVARAGATVTLATTPSGSQVAITGTRGSITTSLVRDGLASVPWSHPLRSGAEVHVGTVAPDARLRVTLPTGPVTVCPGS